ncbi:MAG: ribonuclease H-like domain-containing protein [bacterium]|nr:ribonuclease H-like domain-containing protein [bacterium]
MTERNEFLEKLKESGLLKKASEIKGPYREQPYPIEKLFPEGEYRETPYKRVFRIRREFGPEERTGDVMIRDFFNFRDNFPFLFSVLGKNEKLKSFQIDKLLFFDVESTGLTSGAGNMVFLIGIGYFSDDEKFITEQYFIEDFTNEKGLLYILKEIFSRKRHLVSFNGKSFDFYVLKNRFVLSRRFDFTLDNLLHFDLLHSSRRLWKDRIREFSLGCLEKDILHFTRSNEDIPGYLVPEYYKDYLKTRNAQILEKVFYHNLMDVRSMLALLTVQLKNLHQILQGVYPENINYMNIARLLKTLDKELYVALLRHDCLVRPENRSASLKLIYLFHKSERETRKMAELLHQMLDECGEFDYYIYRELSIYYERHEKKANEARRTLEDARGQMERLARAVYRNFSREMEDVSKRLKRLEKKCSKN